MDRPATPTANPFALFSFIALSLAILVPSVQAEGTIGVGLGIFPKYEGSDDYRALPVPVINYESGNFFISPRAGLPSMGLKTNLSEDWAVGAFVGMHLGRKSRRSSHLKGMDNIDFHGIAGLYTEWKPGPFSIGAAYYQALHGGYGGTAELRGSYLAWQGGSDTISLGVGTQWSNSDSMKTHFGVRQRESAASNGRLRAYSPSAGFKSVSVYGTWHRHLGSQWSMATTLGFKSLVGDAEDSPIVQDKTSVFGNVGLMYSF